MEGTKAFNESGIKIPDLGQTSRTKLKSGCGLTNGTSKPFLFFIPSGLNRDDEETRDIMGKRMLEIWTLSYQHYTKRKIEPYYRHKFQKLLRAFMS